MDDATIAPVPLRRCSKCGVEKPKTKEFFGCYKDGRGYTFWKLKCRDCMSVLRRERYWAGPEEKRSKARDWVRGHASERAAYSRAYHQKNIEVCRTKALDRRNANREKAVADSRKWRQSLRAELIAAYGGVCTCCGETEPRFLTLEHVNRDGAEHRRRVGAGTQLYMSLRRQGWPKEGLTLLCWNCQMASWFYGACPHKGREADREETPA